MNLKKFISGVSALTIAASAFAGLAVTANAETERRTVYTLDYTTGSWTEGDTDGWTKTAGNFEPTFGVVSETGFNVTPATANNNYRDYTISKTLDKSYTGDNVDITLVANTGTAQPQMTYYLTDDAGNTILSVTADRTNTKYIINGTDYATLADGTTTINSLRTIAINDSTLTISANANFTTHTGTVSITIVGSNGTTYSLVNDAAFTFEADSFGGLKMVKSGNYSTKYTYNPNVLKSVTVVNDVEMGAGYTLTTTPYSLVTVGSDSAVNSGFSGEVVIPTTEEGEKSVTITKPGYTEYSGNVNITSGGSSTIALTPAETGVSYYEDFSQVDDQFGFDTTDKDSVVSVNDGKLVVSNLSTSNGVSTSGMNVDIKNKLLTVNMMVNARSDNNQASLKIAGPNVRVFNFNQSTIYFYGNNNRSSDMAGSISDRNAQYMNVQIDATNQKVYIDGKYLGTCTMAGTTLTGFEAVANKGSQVSTGIAEIKVSTLPGEAVVTIEDETAENPSVDATYLAGTEITLPAAAGKEGFDFKGWSDGTTTYEAGAVVAPTADTTYTAVYETPQITEVDGEVAVAETFSGDKYDGEATALTATFDITGATVNTVTVTPDGVQVVGEAQSQAIPATSETTLVYGIVVNKIVDKDAFTAKATFVE